MSVVTKIFGDANKRYLKSLSQIVESVNLKEEDLAKLSDSELRAKTNEFKTRVSEGQKKIQPKLDELRGLLIETTGEAEQFSLKEQIVKLSNQPLDEILPDAFSVVREVAKRTMKQRHYDVQLIGGIVLHEGSVAEMRTGEGKTLTSTLAVYLNALTGRGVHVVTVNDYLAKRDAVWMAQIYHFLGLSTGIIVHDTAYIYDPENADDADDKTRDEGVIIEMDYIREVSRKEAYAADITYGTNNEFGFDYLRDNMVRSQSDKVQRELHYAIIDEVDSILIDEARTPLIISAPDTRPTDRYYQFAQLVRNLKKEDDFTVDEKQRAVSLTDNGIQKIEKALGVDNLYVEEGISTVHHIEQALKAQNLFTKDKDYTIKDGQVIIVDEFTGRLLPGRRYSEGLHQAIEAKEGLSIQQESRTMATITFQNYFRLYHKLSGMTGTAETEAEEMGKIYALDVTTIPTHKPVIRDDKQDKIYKNEKAKFAAVVEEIKARHKAGQPVLVGTISIEKNEYLSSLLEKEGLKFNMLNAKQHEREAEVVAQAGAPGAITIATNMAGRGVDIKLGGQPVDPELQKRVIEAGGLHVLGTERHESRRIDNQLRGRSGRQGDPGSSQFFVSLEDDLMRIFGGDRAKALMKNWPDNIPIENKIISRSIESAQKKVEGHNFDIRKHLVEYDDVANKQRMHIYALRNGLLDRAMNDPDSIAQYVRDECLADVESLINSLDLATKDAAQRDSNLRMLAGTIHASQTQLVSLKSILDSEMTADEKQKKLFDFARDAVEQKIAALENDIQKRNAEGNTDLTLAEITKELFLRSIDMLWVEHLETMQYLRTGIGLRGYGQRDPVVEYKRESRQLFNELLVSIRSNFVKSLMHVGIQVQPAQPRDQKLVEHKAGIQNFSGKERENNESKQLESKPKNEEGHKIGRNDPCFCGSGKKYKKCHGA